MTYRLHNRLGSGGFAVEATLTAAGIPFTYDPIQSKPNQALGPKVAGLNPWGQVPVLELADGTKLSETAAILIYLSQAEAAVKDGPYIGIDDHPMFLRWTVFLAVNVYEGILRQTYSDRYFQTSAENAAPELAAAVRSAATARVHSAFQCIEAETKDHAFVLGERMSPCDVFLAMLYAWHNAQPDLPKCTWITTQVATDGIIRPIWERNFHDRMDFRWHAL